MKKRTIAILVAIVLVIGAAVGTIFWLVPLRPDWETAALMRERVVNAQFVPPIELLVDLEEEYEGTLTNGITSPQYVNLIGSIGQLTPTFSVNNMRDMVTYMTERVGIFDTWFSYRGSGGGSPSGNFYMSHDIENDRFTMINVRGFQPWIFDAELNTYRGNEHFGRNRPITETDVRKISFFYNEDGYEVVEIEIVRFLTQFNTRTIAQHVFMRNVRDTSFTKYVINPHQRVSVGIEGEWGYDVTTNRPLGMDREFIHINYSDPENISVLFMQQFFAGRFNNIVDFGQIQYFNITNGDLSLFESRFAFGTHAQSFGIGFYTLNVKYSANLLDNFTMWRVSSSSTFNTDIPFYENYYDRSTQNIDFIDRIHEDQDAVDKVGDAILRLLKELGVKEDVLNSFDPTQTAFNIFEQAVWELMESATAEIIDNSFVANNYRSGMNFSTARGRASSWIIIRNVPEWAEENE